MDKFNWNVALRQTLPAKWRSTRGIGIKIAVIDTGADLSHPDLQHLDQPGHKFYPALPSFSWANFQQHGDAHIPDLYNLPPDPPGHGTQGLSILAAFGRNAQQFVRGIAPLAEVFIIKTTDATGTTNSLLGNYLNALELAARLLPDIIVGSLVFRKSALVRENIDTTRLEKTFSAVSDSGALFFSAVENTTAAATQFETAERLPNLHAGCINVAAQPVWLPQHLQSLQQNSSLHFLVHCGQGLICKPGGNRSMLPHSFPNSYAVYVVAGMAGLILSHLKKSDPAAFVRAHTKQVFFEIIQQAPLPDLPAALTAPPLSLGIFRNF